MKHAFRAVVGSLLAQWIMTGSASAADCAGVFKFVPNERLSIPEYYGVTDPDRVKGPNGTVLVARPTDWEEAAMRGRWWLWGLVYAERLGGRGPVGGALWVSDREAFGPSGGGVPRVGKDGVYLNIKPYDVPIKGCKGGFTFRLNPQGRLFANGVLVGRAKDVTEK